MRIPASPARLLALLGAIAVALIAGCEGDPVPPDDAPASATSAAATAKSSDGRTVKAGDTVAVHYRGTLDDGTEFDSSKGRDPLTFVVGSGQVIPGFDDVVMGLKVGDKNKKRVEAPRAYGDPRPELIVTAPASQAPAGLKVGDRVNVSGQQAVVTKVDATSITVDANHPLAGKALTFEVELISIK
jgi:FKBP-type peptidyl-prolyl cis-trans isomerase 2